MEDVDSFIGLKCALHLGVNIVEEMDEVIVFDLKRWFCLFCGVADLQAFVDLALEEGLSAGFGVGL